MQVEQAIFTSTQSDTIRGYHLAARSPGIDERLAKSLTGWGPSHGALPDDRLEAHSLNFHHAGGDAYVVSRTVFGGPEYSDRGGWQLFTTMLVLTADQFAGYDCCPLTIARTAMSLGALWLAEDAPTLLPLVELPDSSLPRESPHAAGFNDNPLIPDAAREQLIAGQRLVCAGIADPLAAVCDLLARLSPEQRREATFTTALAPSAHRPFRLQFAVADDEPLLRRLRQQGVEVVA